jgi:hypothetical protein
MRSQIDDQAKADLTFVALGSSDDQEPGQDSRTGWGRWLGDLGFAPSSEISSIEHDTKQVRRNEGKLSCS